MKRDMDLIRNLLLEMESGKTIFEIRSDGHSQALALPALGMNREEVNRLEQHLKLIHQHGLAVMEQANGGIWRVKQITWSGHDFIDSIRDDEIWAQTKAGAEKAKGFTVDIMIAVAKGLIKTKLEKHTGIEIDL